MGNAMDLGDVLLEPKEAAAFLRVSISWMAKARATNNGPPFVRIGRCVRYSKAALLRWLKSQEC
jgi:predicted DNA-binding transcriptional regulator AlpA